MVNKELGAYVAVFSHKRAANVKELSSLIGYATWYVGFGERQAYERAGAERVVESGGLCESRNAAINDGHAKGLTVIEMSDDLKRIKLAIDNNNKNSRSISFLQAAELTLSQMAKHGARLAGCAPTANAFYFNPNKPYSTNSFIVGDLIAVKPSPERFDETLRLKEDYDFTLQHLSAYGVVLRCNAILAEFQHRTNKGGAVSYRTSEMEQQTIAQLKERWGSAISDNPRRPDEILMRWKSSAA